MCCQQKDSNDSSESDKVCKRYCKRNESSPRREYYASRFRYVRFFCSVDPVACRNLLVGFRQLDDEQIKITDFGLSRIMEAETYTASKDATFPLRWTAPETLSMGIISRASDVWSFGKEVMF